MTDGTTVCPSCGARLWYKPEVRCVCGLTFNPDNKEPFNTAAEKRKMQAGTTASPAKGPQPVTGKPKRKKATRSKAKSG